MNAIENGKMKHVNFEFILAVCQKCHVSADYILGLKNDYRNTENEFVCHYTGLNEYAVSVLHAWAEAKDNGSDISKMDCAFWGNDGKEEIEKMQQKQEAIQFLKILNLLFREDPSVKKKKNRYSNLRILYSLYTLCMEQPITITGKLKPGERLYDYLSINRPDLKAYSEHVSLDASDILLLQDESQVFYPFDAKSVIEHIARRNLDDAIDALLCRVKEENSYSGKKK